MTLRVAGRSVTLRVAGRSVCVVRSLRVLAGCLGVAGVAVVALISVTGGGAAASASKHRPRPSLSERKILALAEAAAARDGDSRPTLIRHAAGTHFQAVRISEGDRVFEWNWSYLIAIRGHFIAIDASYPPGGKPPRGTVLTLVVDARTGRVTDGGLGYSYPRLARLGPVTTDLRRPARARPRSSHRARRE